MRIIDEALYLQGINKTTLATIDRQVFDLGLTVPLEDGSATFTDFGQVSELLGFAPFIKTPISAALSRLAADGLITVTLNEGCLRITWGYIIPHYPTTDTSDLYNIAQEVVNWAKHHGITDHYLVRADEFEALHDYFAIRGVPDGTED